MKRLYVLLGALSLAIPALAVDPGTVNVSSFTQSNDTTACIVISTGPGGSPIQVPHYLDKVVVAGASGTGSTLVLYNSTWTNTPIISSISLNTIMNHNFENLQVKGLCYTTTLNTQGVTIIYKK